MRNMFLSLLLKLFFISFLLVLRFRCSSLFRSIFKDLLTEMRHSDDESRSHLLKREQKSVKESSNPNLEFSIEEQWDCLSLKSQSSQDSLFSTDANRFLYICEQLHAPLEFVEVVGKRLLGIKNLVNAHVASGTPNLDSIVDFLADAFIRCTKHVDLVILALDDAHEMDQMSWKVVQTIFERGENVLTLCGSRPPSTNPLAVDPGFWADLHDSYLKKGRFVEIDLQPLSEGEVRDLIAVSLNLSVKEIDSSFWLNIFNTTGGMPHYLSKGAVSIECLLQPRSHISRHFNLSGYALESIKRQELFTRLENGLIGLKNAVKEEEKVSV